MKKLAVYVEGLTEKTFVAKLLKEIAGAKNIQIRLEGRRHGGGGGPRTAEIYQLDGAKSGHRYYAQIIDCKNDNRVASDIRDEYQGLINAGFDSIIAVRDVRGSHRAGVPNTSADIPKIRYWMGKFVPKSPICPTMILAIMEVEAWFIAESKHFQVISPQLTIEEVSSVIGFDPSVEPWRVEGLPTAAETLDAVYKKGQTRYEKNSSSIQRTVGALDCLEIYANVGKKVPALSPLVEAIDTFLT